VADTITVTYKVKEDGSLQKISKNADKAAASTKNATNAAAQHNKQQKGVIGATSNSTKAFSKMTTGITGGLVPAYATLAANVFALTALFGALSRAASLRLLEEGLLRVGNAAGTNLSYVADGLKKITGAAISTEAAMRSVALATSAGFSTSQLQDLTKVAKGASIALGRDMGDAMDRLVRGTAKLEPEILDELGIMVRLDDAVAAYAVTLGKNAKDLTQYERRMAFVTATNDQGLKKFGALAEVVDVNPYDRLAASFANLTKIGVNLLNVVVEPIVNFLSSNPLALTGAIAIFASTLVKQIVPAITASADAARNMAKATHKEAVRLAKKTNSSFKVVAGKIKSLDFAPKSIKKMQDDLQAGKIKGKELQQALRNVVQSEKLRTVAIKNTTKENLAQKEKELASVRALRAEIEATARAEGQRGASSGALSGAKGMSSTSRKTAAAFKMMEGAGPIQSFKIAAASTGKQAKDIGKATGALNKLNIGFKVAGNSAKLFGTALLNAIPVIGQIIMAVSILWPLISKLIPEKTAVAKAADKATESFASFHDIADQLNKTLDTSNDVVADFVSRLNVSTGVVDQVASAFTALKEAQDEANKEQKGEVLSDERDKLEKVYELQNKIKEINSKGQLGLWDYFVLQDAANKLEDAQESLAKVREEGSKTLAKLNEFDRVSAFQTINASIMDLESSGLKEALGDQFDGVKSKLVAIKAAISDGFFTDTLEDGTIKEIPVTFDEIAKRLAEANQPAQGLKASIEAAGQSSSDFLSEVTKLGGKNKTPFDPMLEKLTALNIEYDNTLKDGDKAGKAFEQGSKGYQKVLADFSKIKEREREDTGETLTLHGRLQKRLEENREIMITSGRAVKEIAAQNKAITQFAKNNGAAQQLILDNNEEIRTTKEAALKAEKDSYNIVGLTEEQSKRILEINQELDTIGKERLRSSEDGLLVDIENIKHAQKILDISTKIAASEKQIALDGMKRAENQAKMTAMSAGRDFTPLDELKQFKATEEKRKEIIYTEMANKLHAIALEQQLLTAQTKLQKARATIVEKELGLKEGSLSQPFTQILDLYPKMFATKMAAAISSARTQASDIDLEGATKQSAVSQAAVGASATGDTSSERIMNTIRAGGVDPHEGLTDTAKAVATITTQMNQLDPMLEKLKTLGPEGELVSALAGGAMAIQSAFTTMAHSLSKEMTEGLNAAQISAVETVGKLQVAAAAVGMVQQALAASSNAKISGIDKEIEAEKRRDGKSAASVAKIDAMEKKKLAAQKKAFAANKAMQIAQIAISTASAMVSAAAAAAAAAPAAGPAAPIAFAAYFAGMGGFIAALGAAQIAIVASTSFQGGGGGGGGAPAVPSKVSVGNRNNSVDMAKARSPSGELGYARGEGGTGQGMTNFRPTGAFSGYKHRAGGGYIVGEQGPELFMPDVPGEIISSGQETGGATNVTFNINAVDAAGVEDLLLTQRGNIIGMIRESANAHGENFLEGVNTMADTGSGAPIDGQSGSFNRRR